MNYLAFGAVALPLFGPVGLPAIHRICIAPDSETLGHLHSGACRDCRIARFGPIEYLFEIIGLRIFGGAGFTFTESPRTRFEKKKPIRILKKFPSLDSGSRSDSCSDQVFIVKPPG